MTYPFASNPALDGLPIVLGGNVFGWTADRAESFRILDAFVDGGGCMIDTADVYSAWITGHRGGESESVIGAWLKTTGKRGRVRIATKVGMLPGTGGKGLAPARIAAACEESLTRLGIDQIDLYYAHQDDPQTDQSEVAEAFSILISAGKIANLGASNFTAERLESALAVGTPYSVLQPEYNLVSRGLIAERLKERRGPQIAYEGGLQDLCVDRGIAVLPYFGLASGFLTGKYRSAKDLTGNRSYRVTDYFCEPALAVLEAMDVVARETGANLTQIALAWLRVQPGIAAPIASVSNIAQLEDLFASVRLNLTAAQLSTLSNAGLT
ncbi:aldo/keto reductase [Novosphingobium sp.]|uniref:aldo/keto reductase n=1 Tax=Novosphingobium sp. TaxID=1874826 RepID=UPI0025F01FEB|nr:aldo/keto reductase [Novosphingobium sp.]